MTIQGIQRPGRHVCAARPPVPPRSMRASNRGSALVFALIGVIAVALMSAGLIQLSSAISRRSSDTVDNKSAFYLAEAGLAEGYRGLMTGNSGQVGSASDPVAYGNGLFWVDATHEDDGFVRLESYGMCNAGRAALAMVLERKVEGDPPFGVFSKEPLEIRPGTLIDGYDSELGSYAEQADTSRGYLTTGADGRVASNGDVELHGTLPKPTHVFGDIGLGGSGALESDASNVEVTGEVFSGGDDLELALARVPFPPTLPAISHAGAMPLVVPPGNVGYAGITIQEGAEIIVQGPATVVVDTLEVSPGATLTLDTSGGAIELVVMSTLEAKSGSFVVNTTADPKLLSIEVAAEDPEGTPALELATAVPLHAKVRAPLANVRLHRGSELFGLLHANGVTMGEDVTLHFDRALTRPTPAADGPRLVSWTVAEVPALIAQHRSDPFAVLGVDRGALRNPADAHTGLWLEIRYRTGPGQSYIDVSTWYDDFDWSLVYDLWHYKVYDEPPPAGVLLYTGYQAPAV